MPKAGKRRQGIDDRPLVKSEYERMKADGALYERITASKRPHKKAPGADKRVLA